MKYLPYGRTLSGNVPTDKKFTGQRLDGTGLYFYNARYYDPQTGIF
jgi:RHS repeat-associated protein